MNQYLLSTYAVKGVVPGAPQTREAMQTFMERVLALEAEMDASGAFVFGGGLQLQGGTTAVHPNNSSLVTHSGPAIDSETQIAGFYVINAASLEAAMNWAGKVANATNHSIEVRPFRATGLLKDSMPGQPG